MPDEHAQAPSSPEHLLGDLKAAIMQIVRARGEVTVRAVRDALQPIRALAYTTMMTVMSRLAQHGTRSEVGANKASNVPSVAVGTGSRPR